MGCDTEPPTAQPVVDSLAVEALQGQQLLQLWVRGLL